MTVTWNQHSGVVDDAAVFLPGSAAAARPPPIRHPPTHLVLPRQTSRTCRTHPSPSGPGSRRPPASPAPGGPPRSGGACPGPATGPSARLTSQRRRAAGGWRGAAWSRRRGCPPVPCAAAPCSPRCIFERRGDVLGFSGLYRANARPKYRWSFPPLPRQSASAPARPPQSPPTKPHPIHPPRQKQHDSPPHQRRRQRHHRDHVRAPLQRLIVERLQPPVPDLPRALTRQQQVVDADHYGHVVPPAAAQHGERALRDRLAVALVDARAADGCWGLGVRVWVWGLGVGWWLSAAKGVAGLCRDVLGLKPPKVVCDVLSVCIGIQATLSARVQQPRCHHLPHDERDSPAPATVASTAKQPSSDASSSAWVNCM